MKKILKFVVIIPFLTGCEDLFVPAPENFRYEESLYNEPAFAQGLLGHAYIGNPLGGWLFHDVATDDAVSNDPNNGYRRMATGQWTSNSGAPMDRWQYLRASMQYINLFISMVDDVKWANDPLIARMINDRLKGDAYGMRALFLYHLILHHGGWDNSGQLLGIPILTEPEDTDSEFNLPRDTFQKCVEQIYADAEMALSLLPSAYNNISDDALVPEKYANMATAEHKETPGNLAAMYSRTFGNQHRNRMSGGIVEAIRAQVTLLAASPGYSTGTSYTWADAAQQMAIVLNRLGANPVAEIDPNGGTWYANAREIDGLGSGNNPKEMLWRSNKETNRGLEEDNFPPTLFGRGRINPTQNLVDAFPMANGYPIGHALSDYNENNPYAGRDPRLGRYILYNGQTAGHQNTVITTAVDGTGNDALGRTETSTRTGYYMKKLLRQDVNANPSGANNQAHYKPFIRFTEIFLGYAEAANEAWGPVGTAPNASYSAYDVIKAIRARAGVGTENGDAYLESIRGDKDAMRELIRNERRLELCFEGHRFWDLRRWQAPITEAARGMSITAAEYKVIPVENRVYADYMYFGPIPYTETLKYSNLQQNRGW
ncbi:MAG: RagB/SusD family nutrient uptake outer membrane protein [Alistipes sp.]|jgi:hypothetical protein|nr:RagB/SusD family nutrient uptake outer membrane protein [Alistipes sp.]